jgi:hypothetical protein
METKTSPESLPCKTENRVAIAIPWRSHRTRHVEPIPNFDKHHTVVNGPKRRVLGGEEQTGNVARSHRLAGGDKLVVAEVVSRR